VFKLTILKEALHLKLIQSLVSGKILQEITHKSAYKAWICGKGFAFGLL